MDITHANYIYGSNQPRSRSRSRTRNSTANSRSTSASRRPSIGKRSLSSSSGHKLVISSTNIDASDRPVPSVVATLDNSLPLDFFKQDVLALTKALRISKWHKKQLSTSNLFVNRILGALTNSIYRIEYKDHQQEIYLPTLLLRVYGKNVDSIIDRDLELEILIKLLARKIGPKLLGIFTNGRFEQFLDGFITLDKHQIRDKVISQMLGRRMKDLHYKMELEPKDYARPVPMAWKLINKWMAIFELTVYSSFATHNVKDEDVLFFKFPEFKALVGKYQEWLFAHYDEEKFSENYKFCHNDTQYGNLLLHESFDPKEIVDTMETTDSDTVLIITSNKKDSNLVVIDFEYSGSNFPAFDLADHFSEWMSDYHDPEKSYYVHSDKYPSQVEMLNLIKSYVEYDFEHPLSNLKTKTTPPLGTTNAEDLLQYEIKKMYNETIMWRSTVQIFWCIWGLIQNGPIKGEALSPSSSRSSNIEGVDSLYSITHGIETLTYDENVVVEDAITSSDDDFDYLKYLQQKAAVFVADMIQFGLAKKDSVPEEHRDTLKFLDCGFFDI